MLKRIVIQTGCCILIVFALFVSYRSGIPALENGTKAVLNYLEVDYTAETVDVLTRKPIYGKPIDKEYTGDETLVYAVGGGKVTAVGENEEIGKYVKITHGNQAESLYGNLNTVNVSTPENVKKGQIIGVYKKTKNKDFYYSFKEF